MVINQTNKNCQRHINNIIYFLPFMTTFVIVNNVGTKHTR